MAADSLVDSIGVNIHCWPGNSYIEGDRWEKVILPALRELRIRHARDGVGLDRGVLARLRQVAQLGIRLTLLSGPEATSSVELSRALDEVGRENIAMLEGVNEPDGWWGGRPGHTPEMAIDHQRILSGIGRARDIPVIASALIGLAVNGVGLLVLPERLGGIGVAVAQSTGLATAGLWLGWRMLPSVLLLAGLLGIGVVLFRRLTGRATARDDALPLGTLLAAAAYPAWLAMVGFAP